MVYLGILVLFCAAIGLSPKLQTLHRNNYQVYITLCGTVIALVSGLRTYHTGSPDTRAYADLFDSMRLFDSFKIYYDLYLADNGFLLSESFFNIFVFLLGRVTDNAHWLVFLTSVYITVCTCAFIRENSCDAPLSIVMYICLGLFTFNMNGMRQAMAMSTCLLAYHFARKRKFFPFVLLVLFAMQFHKTAVCFAPVYFLPLLKNSQGNWFLFLVGLVIFLFSLDKLVLTYNDMSGKDYISTESATGGGLVVILLYIGGIVLAVLQSQVLQDRWTRVAMFGTMVGLASYVSRFFSNQMMERISYYYFYFLLLLVPKSIKNLDDKEQELVKVFLVLASVLLFTYRNVNGDFKDFHFFF